jgi:hypothetical protein
MRMPRVRFSMRMMMVAVAVAGGACEAFVLMAKRARLQEIAASHDHASNYMPLPSGGARTQPPEVREAAVAFERLRMRRCLWHDELRAKYERLARYPWLPVEPDPPMPE